MLIQAVSQTNTTKYQTAFHAKNDFSELFNIEKAKKQIQKISNDKETKELFGTLMALTSAAIAEFTVLVQHDKELKNIINDIADSLGIKVKTENFIPENKKKADKVVLKQENSFNPDTYTKDAPERELYLKITSYFPNLDKEYKKLLESNFKNPDDKKSEHTLNMLENIFKYMSEDNRLTGLKPYLKTLDDYSDCLQDITTNISSTLRNGNSIMYYMVLLNNGKLTKDDIKNWTEVDSLGCDEFMMLKNLDKTVIKKINLIKSNRNYFKITDFQPMLKETGPVKTYAFKLNFDNNVEVIDRFQTVSEIHTAIYGVINLQEHKDKKDSFLVEDIQNEMVDNVLKDRRIDSVYNFIKYINPKSLKHYNMTSSEVKYLSKDDKKYKAIKEICANEVLKLNADNPKLQEICNLINDDEVFGKIINTRHSRLRFITRFVLKDNIYPEPNLHEDCRKKFMTLKNELLNNSNMCNYYCYTHPKSTAPQFYLKDSNLGNFIKITLNDVGSIHTIYEDINKELKRKEQEKKA